VIERLGIRRVRVLTVWETLAVWAALALLYWLDVQLAARAGAHTGAFLGALFTAIGLAFGWLADKAVSIAVVMFHVAVYVGKALWETAIAIARVFREVYGFLKKFWSGVLRPFITWVWREVERLARFLRKVTEPILKFLHRVRREILKLYERFLRPVLDTIDVIRQTLRVLAFLRLEWAKELDRKLAELEDRLLVPLRFALTKINQVIDVVNRVATLDGLLQRITLIGSLVRDAGHAWTVLYNARRGNVTLADLSLVQSGGAAVSAAEVTLQIRDYLRTGSGDLAPYVNIGLATARQQLRDVVG